MGVRSNYIFNTSYQVFTVIVPVITVPYISRVLGASGIGLYSYTFAIASYFVLLSTLGSSTYGTRTIGIYQDNKEQKSKYFWEIFVFRLSMSLIMTFTYTIYTIFFSQDKLITFIQGIYIVGVILDISWFFQGLEQFKKIAIRNFIIKIINIIYIFMFIKNQNDLWKYAFGLVFFTIIGNVALWKGLRGHIKKISVKSLKPFGNTKEIIELFIPAFATQMYSYIDKIMIGWFSDGTLENGYYEQSFKIIDMSLMLITTLVSVMIPRVSKSYAEGKMSIVKGYLTTTYRFVWFLGIPMMMGIIAISSMFVPIFMGDGFEKVIVLLPIMSVLFILVGITKATGVEYLVSTKQQNKYTKFLLIGGIANILFNLILIPKLYSIGAAIGTVMGEVLISGISLHYINKTKQYEIKNIFTISYKYIFAGGIMFLIIYLLKNLMSTSVLALGVLFIAGVGTYFLILLFLRERFIKEGVTIIKNRLLGSKKII